MKLTFKKIKDLGEMTMQVYPVVSLEGVDVENSEEIEDVVSCTVSSGVGELTQMTLTVNIKERQKSLK